MKTQFATLLLLAVSSSLLSAHPWTGRRPDGHAPISVMGDHTHAKGGWMASYRYMTMDMDGLRSGSSDVSTGSQLGMMKYGMVPTKMTMDMHMFGVMRAVSDKLTLVGMAHYLENDMDMKMMSGMTNSAKSNGFGDFKITGLYSLASKHEGSRIHLNLGLSLPTGTIDEKDDGQILGYPMQLGSGTWDLLPGITYLGQTEHYSWGAQASGILRIGENNRNYTLGDGFSVATWGARKLTDSVSVSARLKGENIGNVDGEDAAIATRRLGMDSPTFNPNSRGREVVSVGLGLNYFFRGEQLKGHRFALEWETPLKEDFDGVQLKVDSIWALGWQYAW
tara:strand:- start:155 stop:1159 length:1005 start_codon:yes stop_codon:yes gene_type:complete